MTSRYPHAMPRRVVLMGQQPFLEQHHAVPLCFGAPLIVGVLPRALCREREHGELRTVAFRLTLLRVSTNESYERYRV